MCFNHTIQHFFLPDLPVFDPENWTEPLRSLIPKGLVGQGRPLQLTTEERNPQILQIRNILQEAGLDASDYSLKITSQTDWQRLHCKIQITSYLQKLDWFDLYQKDGNVWRVKGTAQEPNSPPPPPTVKHGVGGVLVTVCIAASGAYSSLIT